MSASIDPETATDGRAKWFMTTHWSVVLASGKDTSAEAASALEKLCRIYWFPLYAYVRRQGYSPHDAQDLTQEFFARLLGRNYLASVEREKGKFRSFLLASLNHFLANERDRANAAKRGGGKVPISLNETVAEELYRVELVSNRSPENDFEKRWAIALLDQAFAKVRSEFVASGKGDTFERLKMFLADGTGSGDYAALTAELGMSAN